MPLAIIIPALNEAGSIGHVIARIPAELAAQIIVVDNGSTDGTAAVAQHAGAQIAFESRRGYGQACLTGLANMRADINTIAFLDADGSDDPQLLLNVLAPIQSGEIDFVVSARTLGLAKRNLSPQQRFGNWLACSLIRWLWRYDYKDLGPLRALTRPAFERLRLRDTTWGWNVEMQIKALECGLRIRQIEVPYGHRIAGQSKISGTITGTIRAGWKILATIGRLWIVSRATSRGVTVPAGSSDAAHRK